MKPQSKTTTTTTTTTTKAAPSTTTTAEEEEEEACSDCKERFRTSTVSQDQLEAYFKQYGGAEPGWP